MKKVTILVENDLGDNLNEWLSLEGFDTSLMKQRDIKTHSKNADIFICAENDLDTVSSDEFSNLVNTKPCIILGEDKAMAPKWLQGYVFLKIPLGLEQLFPYLELC